MTGVKTDGNRARRVGLAVLVIFMNAAPPAAARGVWNCTYEGGDSAHYVMRFEKRASDVVEPHWPHPVFYRILLDTREMLVAVHAYVAPPSFRRDARAGAAVVIIDKRRGRLHRSATAAGDSTDQVIEGRCESR